MIILSVVLTKLYNYQQISLIINSILYNLKEDLSSIKRRFGETVYFW